MAIKTRLTDEDRDRLTKDVDDLDKMYIENMKDAGIEEDWLAQFADLSLQLKGEGK